MKTNNEYAKLLATPEWKAKRESVLKLPHLHQTQTTRLPAFRGRRQANNSIK